MAVIDNSTMRKAMHTLKAGIVTEIVFSDTKPNHIFINSYGDSKLYFAMSQIPSATQYDLVIYPYKSDIWGQEMGVDRIRIFNSGTNDCNVEVTSFVSEFDPSILNKASETVLTSLEGTMEASIESFNTSLPAGTQHIGAVSVDNIPHVVVDDMPEITLSGVTIDASGLTSLSLDDSTAHIGNVSIPSKSTYSYLSGSATTTAATTSSLTWERVIFIANDGSNNLIVSFNSSTEITLAPGEILNDIPLAVTSISVKSDVETTNYRIMGV